MRIARQWHPKTLGRLVSWNRASRRPYAMTLDSFQEATKLGNLGALYLARGAYDKAESLFLRALEIHERMPSSRALATALYHLALLYHAQGALAKSEPLYRRALETWEYVLGAMDPTPTPVAEVHLGVSKALHNLGTLYIDLNQHERAEPLLVRALDIQERVLGSSHPAVAASLDKLGSVYWARGAYPKVEPLWVRAIDIRERVLGEHLDVATSLDHLGALYVVQGANSKAEPLWRRALEVRERVLGPNDLGLAMSLEKLGVLCKTLEAYDKAEPLLLRALDLRERALGTTHPDVATSLTDLGDLRNAQGAYAQAEPLLVRALGLRERALGAMHPDLAPSLHKLASTYQSQGGHEKAEPLLVRALCIRETALGTTHPAVAETLHELGTLHRARGAYAQAETLLVRAVDIREEVLGKMAPELATTLNDLGVLYTRLGAYEQAEPVLRRALDIRKAVLPATHPDVAMSLNNLGTLYGERGAYAQAEPLLARAIDIHELAHGATHASVAKGLHNLAFIYKEQGDFHKAHLILVRALDIYGNASGPTDPAIAATVHALAQTYPAQHALELYQIALKMCEANLGPNHPELAPFLCSLATGHRDQGAYDRAEPLYLRAIDILEKALGATHPELARALGALALSSWGQRAYDRAESLWLRALDIRERTLGATHPDVALSLHDLGLLYRTRGQPGRALPLLARAVAIGEHRLGCELAPLSARAKHSLVQVLRATESAVSLHADAMPDSVEALELALTTVLRRKGRAIDSLIDNRMSMLAAGNPDLRHALRQLATSNAELTVLLRAPNRADERQEIARVRARIDDLESTLNAASAQLGKQSELVTVTELQAAMPCGAALVEFVSYPRFDVNESMPWRERRYVAYFLPWQGPPRWIALGEAALIDAAVEAMLVEMRNHLGIDGIETALWRLDALVFAPIRHWLADVSHVIVSPDATLNLVPFEALSDGCGGYAIERWLFSYVGSGRDLLRLQTRRSPRSIATIVAAPEYGAPHAPFTPLNGALAEAEDIPAYLSRVRTLIGAQATKAALATTIGPSVLHIATHGFFARDGVAARSVADLPSGVPRRTVPRDVVCKEDAVPIALPPELDDPTEALDQAGLALAGANLHPDGVLTARELASYDWWGTQLVVLSACDTGLGVVPAGDGVYGLRRALVLAGTEAQVVSLWSVSDTATRELMHVFYSELAKGTGRAEALRRAKLQTRSHSRYAHPYYWAAFIAAGDWTPLDWDIVRHGEHVMPAPAVSAPASPCHPWAAVDPVDDANPRSETTGPSGRRRPGNREAAMSAYHRFSAALASTEELSPPEPPSELPAELTCSLVLLMTGDQLAARVSIDALAELIKLIDADVTALYARGEIVRAPLALFVVVKPIRRLRVWVEGIEGLLAEDDIALIERRASAWRAPEIQGALAFVYQFTRTGAANDAVPRLPLAWREAARIAGRFLELPDAMVTAVWPD